MTISIYDISVASYLQTLEGVAGVMEKGKAHLTAEGKDINDIVDTSLYPDMLPFRFQIISVAHHSMGAIEGIQAGVFSPPPSRPELDYEGLQGLVEETRTSLQRVDADTVNALEGNDMMFKMGKFSVPFTAESFILSFSLPNFYFHATTAYDVLRMQGVPIGKMDFLATMQVKT
jgi:hypothetical protein